MIAYHVLKRVQSEHTELTSVRIILLQVAPW